MLGKARVRVGAGAYGVLRTAIGSCSGRRIACPGLGGSAGVGWWAEGIGAEVVEAERAWCPQVIAIGERENGPAV